MMFRVNAIIAAVLNLVAVGCLAATSIAGTNWGLGRTALIAVLFFSGAQALVGGFHKSSPTGPLCRGEIKRTFEITS